MGKSSAFDKLMADRARVSANRDKVEKYKATITAEDFMEEFIKMDYNCKNYRKFLLPFCIGVKSLYCDIQANKLPKYSMYFDVPKSLNFKEVVINKISELNTRLSIASEEINNVTRAGLTADILFLNINSSAVTSNTANMAYDITCQRAASGKPTIIWSNLTMYILLSHYAKEGEVLAKWVGNATDVKNQVMTLTTPRMIKFDMRKSK